MSFPVTITFKRNLNTVVDEHNSAQILNYIKDEIIREKANNVIIEDMTVTYAGTTSVSRTSLFGSLKGSFSLINVDHNWQLQYQFNMRELFIITGIMSVAFGIFGIQAGMWWIGFGAFAWLCGANWVICNIRQGLLATEISEGIDRLMGWQKPVVDEEKDESLKSWF